VGVFFLLTPTYLLESAVIASPMKTIAENLAMSTPLLSRFDLIFILLDTPDEEHDRMLSEHVMDVRKLVDCWGVVCVTSPAHCCCCLFICFVCLFCFALFFAT
jgi:MCM P-loop domain